MRGGGEKERKKGVGEGDADVCKVKKESEPLIYSQS